MRFTGRLRTNGISEDSQNMNNTAKKSDKDLTEELKRELDAVRETSIVLRARVVELEIKLERSERELLRSRTDPVQALP